MGRGGVSLFVGFYTYFSWALYYFIASVLTEGGLYPSGMFSKVEWLNTFFLCSPLIAWSITNLLETFNSSLDKSGGALNKKISIMILSLSAIAAWNAGSGNPTSLVGYIFTSAIANFAVPFSSPAWIIAIFANIVMYLWQGYASHRGSGSFYRLYQTSINLIRFGTPTRVSSDGTHGSAALANTHSLAKIYKTGGIVLGLAVERDATVMLADNEDKFVYRAVIKLAQKIRSALMFTKVLLTEITKNSLGEAINTATNKIAIITGNIEKAPLLLNNPSAHVLLEAGSGAGKGVSYVIPTALNYGSSNHVKWNGAKKTWEREKGSFFALDPKGELHAITSRARRDVIGHDVYKIEPLAKDTDAFDILGWLNPENPTFEEHVGIVVQWFIEPPSGKDEGAKFFIESSQNLLFAAIAYNLARWHYFPKTVNGQKEARPTIKEVSKFLFKSPADLQNDIKQIKAELEQIIDAKDNAFGPATGSIQKTINSLTGGDMERTWPNICASVASELSWLKIEAYTDLISGKSGENGRTFNSRSILNGQTSIYLCLPPDLLQRKPALARAIIGPLLQEHLMVKIEDLQQGVGVVGTTLFLFDEMQQLGKFDMLHQNALPVIRGYNVRLFGVIQNSEQFKQVAGESVYDGWVTNSTTRIQMGFGDATEAERTSKAIGETTIEVRNVSRNDQSGQRGEGMMSASGLGVNITNERMGKRLVSPEELVRQKDYAVVFTRDSVEDDYANGRAMFVRKAEYYRRPDFLKNADENPYRFDNSEIAFEVTNENLIEELLRDIQVEKAKRNYSKGDFEFTTAEEYINSEWVEEDVERSVRARAKQSPPMQKMLDALDRYYDDTATEEDLKLIRDNKLIVEDDQDSDTMDAFLEDIDREIREEDLVVSSVRVEDFEPTQTKDPSAVASAMKLTRAYDAMIESLGENLTASICVDTYKEDESLSSLFEKIINLKG